MNAKDLKLVSDAMDAAFSDCVKHAVGVYLDGLTAAAGDGPEKDGCRSRLEAALRTYAEGRRIILDILSQVYPAAAAIS
jgi:hypothetical protein